MFEFWSKLLLSYTFTPLTAGSKGTNSVFKWNAYQKAYILWASSPLAVNKLLLCGWQLTGAKCRNFLPPPALAAEKMKYCGGRASPNQFDFQWKCDQHAKIVIYGLQGTQSKEILKNRQLQVLTLAQLPNKGGSRLLIACGCFWAQYFVSRPSPEDSLFQGIRIELKLWWGAILTVINQSSICLCW